MSTGKDFRSDNAAGAAPEIVDALLRANEGMAAPYGDDPWTAQMQMVLSAVFERDVVALPVFTGTASNALALSCLVPPFGAIFCHEEAHIFTSECGAPELFTGGGRLVGLPGASAKIAPDTLAAAVKKLGMDGMHHDQPAAVSLTQASECGTCYTPDEILALSDVARQNGLRTHMDGARFANAVAGLGATPAEISWRAGVDVLSLGLTKNGAIAAEAVVFFDEALAEGTRERQKRAGQVASKMRFVSAQILAMMEGGRWLQYASHANAMAARLEDGLATLGLETDFRREINEVFISLPREAVDKLRAGGFAFHAWGPDRYRGSTLFRFVTSFATEPHDVDGLVSAIEAALG